MKKTAMKVFASCLAVVLMLSPFATVYAQTAEPKEQEIVTEREDEKQEQASSEVEENNSPVEQKEEKQETKEPQKEEKKTEKAEAETPGIQIPLPHSGYTDSGIQIKYAGVPSLSRATATGGNFILWEGGSHLGYDWGTCIITAEYEGKTQYLYCSEPKKLYPSGNKYTEAAYSNKGIRAILLHGFPSDVSGLRDKYNVSKNQAYVSTFVALNAYLGNFTRSTVESAGDKYVNALLKLADSGADKITISINRSSSTSVYNASKNRLESKDYFKVSANNNTTTSTFKLSNLPAGVYAIDSNGNKITTISFGSNFKLATDNLGYNKSNFSVSVTHNISNPALYQFKANGVQTLLGFWGVDPLSSITFSQTFTAATGNAEISKSSEDGVIEGLKFRVKGTDSSTNTYDKTVTTNNEGKWKFENIVVGEYEISEVETPDRYLELPTQKVKVEENKTTVVTFSNVVKKGKIELFKSDNYKEKAKASFAQVEEAEETQDTENGEQAPQESEEQEENKEPQREKPETTYSLQGIEFTVYKYNSETKEIGEQVEVLTTDETGYAISGEIWYGEYIVKETKTNPWYHILTEPVVFKITEHEKVLKFEAVNEIVTGDLQIYKIDTDTKDLLTGAEFTLYADRKCTQVIEKKQVDKNGTLKFEGLRYGKYYFKETRAPKGYNPCPKTYEFEVNEETAGSVTEVTIGNKKIESVNTGDNTNIILYFSIAAMALIVGGVLVKRKVKNK